MADDYGRGICVAREVEVTQSVPADAWIARLSVESRLVGVVLAARVVGRLLLA